MSTQRQLATEDTEIPPFGTVATVLCVCCGRLPYEDIEKAERMEEFHETFCGGARLDYRSS